MGEELTDREIHRQLTKGALECPNCGGQLRLFCSDSTTRDERVAIYRALTEGRSALVAVEDAIERTKQERDNGTVVRFHTDATQ